jgi:hypothetical protein
MDAAQIALLALSVAFLSMIISACSFVLEVRRWFDEGVKLSISIIAEAKKFGEVPPDPNTYVSVAVTNRGDAPTTITHLVVFIYPNKVAVYTPYWLSRYFKQLQPETGLVASAGEPGPIPYMLKPGTYWLGTMKHTPELKNAIAAGCTYIGIVSSHSDRTFFKRVRLLRRDPAETASGQAR